MPSDTDYVRVLIPLYLRWREPMERAIEHAIIPSTPGYYGITQRWVCRVNRRDVLHIPKGRGILDQTQGEQLHEYGYTLKDLAEAENVPLFEPNEKLAVGNIAYAAMVRGVDRLIHTLKQGGPNETTTKRTSRKSSK